MNYFILKQTSFLYVMIDDGDRILKANSKLRYGKCI